MSGRVGRRPKGDAAKAYRMRQKVVEADGKTKYLHSWIEIARECGFSSAEAAMMAVKRHTRKLEGPQDRWSDRVPDVASHLRLESIYLALMMEAKQNAGIKLNERERGTLERFHREVNTKTAPEPLGVVLVYNPQLEMWAQRARRPEDDPAVSWAK